MTRQSVALAKIARAARAGSVQPRQMKMLALMKYGDLAASTRQRLHQYGAILAQHQIEIIPSYLLSNDYLKRLFSGKGKPAIAVISSYISRLILLLRKEDIDLLWIQYESFPYLPSLFELLAFLAKKPVILDYDDAIFHQYDLNANPLVRRALGGKLQAVMRRASLCTCGNAYLKEYADRFCARTEVVPTVVDTSVYTPRHRTRQPTKPITIGWIGSASTWVYVEPLLPMLRRLATELDAVIHVVGASERNSMDPRVVFTDWSEAREVALIQDMDIGIMPLPDEPWARGKCGYKLIQYMACGLPVVASPVGANATIVADGEHGYLASSEAEWELAIRRLVGNPQLREDMGRLGRRKVEREYSLGVHGPRLAALVRDIADRAAAG